jgi:Tfp pilus assembly protein PilN
VILLISLFAFVFMFAHWSNVSTELKAINTSSKEIEEKLKAYDDKEKQVAQQLTPQQQQLLIATHKLVDRKQFSWSRLFSDLENVLPGGVSVSQINVNDVRRHDDRTEAEIDFSVLSRNYQNVMGMIDRMNSSGIFRAELRGQDLQKSDGGDYTEFKLYLIYTTRGNAPIQQAPDDTQSALNAKPEVRQ